MTSSELDIGAVNDFVQGKPKRVEVNGRALVVVREQDQFYALHDTSRGKTQNQGYHLPLYISEMAPSANIYGSTPQAGLNF